MRLRIRSFVQIISVFSSALLIFAAIAPIASRGHARPLGFPQDASSLPPGTSVSVKMVDAIDSNSGAAGQQYHATVSKALNAGGISIPQGSAAMVTLTKNGSGWSAQLTSLTMNGQAVAVTSTTANVGGGGAAAQNAASAVGSVLGGFGHHSNTAAQVAAAASGARVFLPPGTTLNFTLGAPPAAAAPGAASAPAPAAAPAAAPASASAPASATAPDAGSAPNSASSSSAAPTSSGAPAAAINSQSAPAGGATEAGSYFFCYSDLTLATIYFSDVFPSPLHPPAGPNDNYLPYSDYTGLQQTAFKHFLEQKYSFKSNSNYPSQCSSSVRVPDANMSRQKLEGTYRQQNKQIVETGWTNKDVVPSAYCTSGNPDSALNYSEAFTQNGKNRFELGQAFAKFTKTASAACMSFPDLASAKAERDRQFNIAKKGYKVNDTGWKGQ